MGMQYIKECLQHISLFYDGVNLITTASGSIKNANKKGDNGHPWRVPLFKGNGFEIILLVTSEAAGDLYSI